MTTFIARPPVPPLVAADGRLLLAEKYRRLTHLRRTRDQTPLQGRDPDARIDLAALAAQFPGCLRELDCLGLSELQRRADALRDDRCTEAWMAWIDGYHRLMRLALAIKPRLKQGASPAALLGEARNQSGFPVTAAFLQAVDRPPQGRLTLVVLRALAELFAVPAADLAAALFPLRRPSPYRLDGG